MKKYIIIGVVAVIAFLGCVTIKGFTTPVPKIQNQVDVSAKTQPVEVPPTVSEVSYLSVPELHIRFKNVPGLDLAYTIQSDNQIIFNSNEITPAGNRPGLEYCATEMFPKIVITTIQKSASEFQGYDQYSLGGSRYANVYAPQAPCYTTKSTQSDITLISQQVKMFNKDFATSIQTY